MTSWHANGFRHNQLLMMSQWPGSCGASTWEVISNSLDIDFIHGDIQAGRVRTMFTSRYLGRVAFHLRAISFWVYVMLFSITSLNVIDLELLSHLPGANELTAAAWIEPFHISYNAPVTYPTIHRFVTEMCKHLHISVTKWCLAECLSRALWDLWDWSIEWVAIICVCNMLQQPFGLHLGWPWISYRIYLVSVI